MDEQAPTRMATDVELKELVKMIADGELLISEVTEGFAFKEIIQLVKVAEDVPPVLRDAGIMWPEFTSLDDAARADLLAYVTANCKFPANTNIELIVDETLSIIISLSKIFKAVQKSA